MMDNDSYHEDDRTTVAFIGALAFIVTILLHEALGHAGVNALLGERSVIYPLWTQSSSQSAVMVAAGPAANFISGFALLLILFVFRGLSPHWRYFVWLSAAFNLLNATSYLLLGCLTGFGDWGVLLRIGEIGWPVAIALAVLAAALYYGSMAMLSYCADFSRRRASRLTITPYLAAGTVACAAAAISAQGFPQVFLAAAATFGAGFGLPVISDWNLNPRAAETGMVVYSPAWIAVSAIVSVFYIVVIGRGLAL